MKKAICCSQCRHEIGQVVEVAPGVERLLIGNLLVNVARGVCCVCGTEFHWSISERMLAELIDQVLRLRNAE